MSSQKNNWKNLPKKMRWAYLFQQLSKSATSKNKFFLGIIVVAIIFIFLFINQNWKKNSLSPIDQEHPIVMLDFYSSYSPEVAFQLLEAYGKEKRIIYLITLWTLDLLFPLAYGLALIWVFIHLLRKSFPWLLNDLYKLTFIPLLLTITDLLENISITILILSYPNRFSVLAKTADFFTESKWILVNLVLLIIIIGFIATFMNKKDVIEFESNQHTT